MPTQKKMRSYMKPPAKRTSISKPQQKQKSNAKVSADGFIRINDSTIIKVYK